MTDRRDPFKEFAQQFGIAPPVPQGCDVEIRVRNAGPWLTPNVLARSLVNGLGNQFGQEFAKNMIAQMAQMGGAILQDDPRTKTLEAERDQARAQAKVWADTFEKLKKSPCPHASVVALREKTVTIQSGGRALEVERPRPMDLKVGGTVKVAGDTMQIVEPVEDDVVSGAVLDVRRVVDSKTIEVDQQGMSRAATYGLSMMPLEEGDRVVLDVSGSVVVANLGKPPDMNQVEAATGVCWDDIGGLEHAKRELREAIEAPVKHGAIMAKYGKRAARGCLLYGGPGLGKTMLGKAAATAMAELHGGAGGGFYYVKGPALLDRFVGQTEASIRKLFAQAKQYRKKTGAPAIIFIDEAESILGPRGGGLRTLERGFMSSTVVPQFLSEMDGLEETGAFVLLATNRPNSLDSAVVRDGRIDRRIRVTRPTADDAKSILLKHLIRTPLVGSHEEAIDVVVARLYDSKNVLYRIKKKTSVGAGTAMTLGALVSGAMLAGIVDRAAGISMRRTIASGADDVERVTVDDLRLAVQAAFDECRDVNHDDEIAEFVDGWENEVESITKVERRAHASMDS